MATRYLYQQIMDVPGLTGTWKERLAQYYKKLTGKTYQGTRDEGLYMLDQIAKKNWGEQVPKKTVSPTTTSTSLANQYASTGVTSGENASQMGSFKEKVGDLFTLWRGLEPQATAAAESQINPEIMRNYLPQRENLMGNLASTGGYRMGRGFNPEGSVTGLASLGSLKASTERNRQAQLQDWLNQYRTGFNELWYTPSETAWNKATTQGSTPSSALTKIPTWNEVYSKYNTMYGVGDTTSPLYG